MLVSDRPTPLLPAKVLRTALAAGLSEICLFKGHEGACSECQNIILNSFDLHYGHLNSMTDVVREIRRDIENDIKDLP